MRQEQAVEQMRQEARRQDLLQRRQQDMAGALARSTTEFVTRFPGFEHVDLSMTRAYMLGERHDCHSLPIALSLAIGNYRRDLLARQLKSEPDREVVRLLTVRQQEEVVGALIRHFDHLMGVSDGLSNCATWHPLCRSTNDHPRSRRSKQRDCSRRWQQNVLSIYIKHTGVSAVSELYSYAQIPLPQWLRTQQRINLMCA